MYDCDAKKEDKDINGKLFIRGIPFIEGRKSPEGIENLFNDDLIKDDIFYKEKKAKGKCGAINTIREPDKRGLCNYICARNNPADFEDFKQIIEAIKKII